MSGRRGRARGRSAPALPPAGDEPVSHQPVLLAETVAGLVWQPDGRYIDGTVGLGGHAEAILRAAGPAARLLGIDADPDALVLARQRLAPFGERVRLVQGNFRDIAAIAEQEGFASAAGVLLDLGVSSLQFGPQGRGFAFRWEAALDMRMDPAGLVSAATLVNEADEEELASLIFQYGEERRSRRIARAIVQARPVATTIALARVIEQAVGGAADRVHPATRTFQALRIAVNRELEALTAALGAAHDLLDVPGGRLAVLSYHSLEDRIVKQFIEQAQRDCLCPPRLPVCVCGHHATLRRITAGAVQPPTEEVATNPRARSARLRIAARR